MSGVLIWTYSTDLLMIMAIKVLFEVFVNAASSTDVTIQHLRFPST
jgi:hypothetical protein